MLEYFANLFFQNPIAQSFGFLATFCYLLSALQKTDKRLQGIMLLGTTFWVLHYSLLEAWVAALGYMVGIYRNYVIYFNKINDSNRIKLNSGIITAYLLIGLFTIKQPYECIPIFCSILYAIALLNLKGIKMRSFMMVSQLSWFYYALVVGSIGGMITCLSEFALTLTTVTRLIKSKN